MLVLAICSLVALSSAASRTCKGNILNLNPTGKRNGGVAASVADVKVDLPYLEQQRSCYQASANAHCIQASVLAAIASRESRGGSLLVSTGGYGDRGRAWGIMQCDVAKSSLACKSCAWNSCCHIEMMSAFFVSLIDKVRAKHPRWTQDQALQGGVAAYNFGVSNVRTLSGLDVGTTGNDYSNDVVARAQYLQSKNWN